MVISGPPPEFKGEIPNFKWEENTNKENAFKLDDYFISPDGDILSYSVIYDIGSPQKVEAIIAKAAPHWVSFKSPQGWNGQDALYFEATNPEHQLARSNKILLEVTKKAAILITQFIVLDEIVVENERNEFSLEVTARYTGEGDVGFTYTTNDDPNLIFQGETKTKELAEAEGAVYWHSRTIWKAGYPKKGRYYPTISVVAKGLPQGPESRIDKSLSILVKNHALKITAISLAPQGEILEGQKIIITPTAEDQDQDEITYNYHVDKPKANAKINHTGPNLLWLTDYEDAGDYLITITGSDGIATVQESIPLKIRDKNRAPEITEFDLNKTNLSVNETLNLSLKANDPDGEAISLVIKQNGNPLPGYPQPIANNAAYQKSISFPQEGFYEISAQVTDEHGLASLEEKEGVTVTKEITPMDPIVGDFNGDSRTDIGLYYYTMGSWQVALSQKDSYQDKNKSNPSPKEWLSGFGASGSHEYIAIGGDFNGDAKSDIASYDYANGVLKIAFSTGTSFSKIDAPWVELSKATGSWQPYSSWQPFSGNFNADRFTDFGLYNRDSGEVRIALGNGSSFSEFRIWLATDLNNKGYAATSGDFNGDSLTDICLFKKTDGSFKVGLSNTKEFKDLSEWLSNFSTNKDLLVSDFNNDGLTDVGYWDKPKTWHYAISTGATFKDMGVWLDTVGNSNEKGSVTSADFDGNGITDAASFDPNQKGTDAWDVVLSAKKPADLLTDVSVGGGNNGKTKVEYGYAAQESNNQLPFPVYVVRKVSAIDILPIDQPQETYNQVFDYSDGYFDAQEREFRGFARAKVTDPLTNNYTITEFYQALPGEDGALKGQIKKLSAYDGNIRDASGQKVSETINKYEVKKGGPAERFLGFPALIEQATTAWEENRDRAFTRGSTEYDNIGNPLKSKEEEIKASVGNKVSEIARKSFSETAYYPAYESGFNRPQAVYLKDKDGNIISEKNFKYNPQGNLKQETLVIFNPLGGRGQSRQEVYAYYDYDPFGNLTTTTNAKGAKTTTYYESTFSAFPEKVVNSLGHTVSYEYDFRFGAATKVTDPNKHTSETIYDDLGRVTTVKNVNQEVVSEYEYPDFNTKITKQNGLFSIEHIDGLGRRYKSESSGEDGTAPRKVASETYYNVRGQVASESLPHYIDEDPAKLSYIRYEYDTRGRLIRSISDFAPTKYPAAYPIKLNDPRVYLKPGDENRPADAASEVFYINPLYSESKDPLGQRKGVLKDAYGNIVEVNEFIAGEQGDDPFTTYKYDLQNNLIETKDRKRNITRIFYDSAGRKLKMNDPDMGEWSYEYDILGNLLKQTDAKKQVLEFKYDALNRLVKKTRDDGRGLPAGKAGKRDEVNYIYDEPPEVKPNCTGRLSKVIDQSGSSEFLYDNLGREEKSIKTITTVIAQPSQNTAYTIQREYDIQNRLTHLTYPDGEVVQYGYDTNSGLLERVYTQENEGRGKKDEGREYVQDISYNAKGQIKTILYGNGVSTNYDYGPDLRLSHVFTQKQGNPALQDLYYYFYADGNISKIENNLANTSSRTRRYFYDELGRLTRAENVPAASSDGTPKSATLIFGYDSIGNMVNNAGMSLQYRKLNAGPHAVTDANGYSYRYDANGNMTQGKNKTLEYDAENRLTQVSEGATITSFIYDGDGGRVRKTKDEGRGTKDETTYVGALFETTDSTDNSARRTRKHIFAGSQRVCSVTKDEGRGTTGASYYHPDHLGSSNIITDQDGHLTQHYEYTPYGTTAVSEVVPHPSSLIPPDTSLIHHKFTGKELDKTGLYYYGARYYDPQLGRFISADSIIQAPYDPQSLNRYSYCRNNPINYVDPTGHSWKSFWKKVTHFFEDFGNFISPLGRAIVTGDWKSFGMIVASAVLAVASYGILAALTPMVMTAETAGVIAISAIETASVLDTKPGGWLINQVSTQIFDDAFGMRPGAARMWGSAFTYMAVNAGFQAGLGAAMATQGRVTAKNYTSGKDKALDVEVSKILKQGEGFNYGGSPWKPEQVSRVLFNKGGELVGVASKSNILMLGAQHTGVVMSNIPSLTGRVGLRGIPGVDMYGLWGISHQAVNVSLLEAGYSSTVMSVGGGWTTAVSTVVYGPYGGGAAGAAVAGQEK